MPLSLVAEKQYHLNKVSGPRLTFSWWWIGTDIPWVREERVWSEYFSIPGKFSSSTHRSCEGHGARSKCALFSQLCRVARVPPLPHLHPPPHTEMWSQKDPADSAHRESSLCMGGGGEAGDIKTVHHVLLPRCITPSRETRGQA